MNASKVAAEITSKLGHAGNPDMERVIRDALATAQFDGVHTERRIWQLWLAENSPIKTMWADASDQFTAQEASEIFSAVHQSAMWYQQAYSDSHRKLENLMVNGVRILRQPIGVRVTPEHPGFRISVGVQTTTYHDPIEYLEHIIKVLGNLNSH